MPAGEGSYLARLGIDMSQIPPEVQRVVNSVATGLDQLQSRVQRQGLRGSALASDITSVRLEGAAGLEAERRAGTPESVIAKAQQVIQQIFNAFGRSIDLGAAGLLTHIAQQKLIPETALPGLARGAIDLREVADAARRSAALQAEAARVRKNVAGPNFDEVRFQAEEQLFAQRQSRAIARQRLLLTEPADIVEAGGNQFLTQQHNIRRNTVLQRLIAGDETYAREQAELTALIRRNQRAQAAATRAATEADIPAAAREKVEAARRRTREAQAEQEAFRALPESGRAELRARAEVAAEKQRQAAFIREETQRTLAADQGYIRATANARQAQELRALRIRAATIGVQDERVFGDARGRFHDDRGRFISQQSGLDRLRTETVVKEQVQAAQRQLEVDKQILANKSGELNVLLERRRIQTDLNRVLERQSRNERLAARGVDPSGPGTRFQQLQQHFARRGSQDDDRLPVEFQRLGQFVGQRAIQSGAYAIAGAGIYGAVAAIREMVQEVERLERALVTVESQLRSIGEGDTFGDVRGEILELSRNTGIAADQVATVFFQLKGAFGDTDRALAETNAGLKISIVSGLELREITDSLTAASISYGVSLEEIGDKAVGIEERFGVLQRESLKVFGDLATSASQAGLNLDQLGAIAGVVQQRSGRGGAAIAEGLGRVLPTIQNQAGEILRLYENNPVLRGDLETVTGDLRQGETGQVLLNLIKNYGSLDEATRKYIITLLGGRREAQILNPIFQGQADILEELARTESDAGKTTERFEDLQRSLAQTMARVAREIEAIGFALAEAGLLDAFKLLGLGVEATVKAVALGVRIFSSFNDALFGIPGKLTAITVAVVAITKAMAALATVRAATSTIRGLVAGRGAATAAVPGAATRIDPITGLAFAETAAVAAAARGSLADRLRQRGSGFLGAAGRIGARQFGPPIPARFGGGQLAGAGLIGSGLFAAGGASAGLLSLGAGAGAFVAAEQTFNAYSRLDARMRRLTAGLQEKIRRSSYEELLAARERRPSRAGSGLTDVISRPSFEGIGSFLAGEKTSGEQVLEGLNRETIASFKRAADGGLFNALTEDQIKEIKERFDGNEVDRALALRDARDAIANLDKKQAETLRVMNDKSADNREILDTQGEGILSTVDDVRSAFESGQVGFEEYAAALTQAATRLRAADNGADPAFHQKVLDSIRLRNQVVAQNIAASLQFAQGLRQLAGQDPAEGLQAFTEALRPNARDWRRGYSRPAPLTDLERDPQALLQVTQAASQIQQQAFQTALTRAGSAEERLTLLREGVELDPEIRKAYERYQIKQFGQILVPVGERLRGTQDQIRDAVRAALQERIRRMEVESLRLGRDEDPVLAAGDAQRIAGALTAAANPPPRPRFNWRNAQRYWNTGGTVTEEERLAAEEATIQADRDARDARQEVALSRIALAQTQAGDDALGVAQLEVRAAEAELASAIGEAAQNEARGRVVEARRQVRDALRAQADARLELARALQEEDPLLTSLLDIAAADEAIARAGNDATAQAQAAAQRVRADRAKRDALRAIADSVLELGIVMAEVAGDSIRVADERLRLAERHLAERVADITKAGGDPNNNAEINQLRGAVAQARDAAGDARLSEQQAEIDFLLSMEQITVGHAIERFRALLQLADDPEETRALLLKIRQLEKEASADLQFNIPSEIRLPTLYEVRRSLAAERLGGGYQDNRTVIFTMTNNNATDYQGAIDRFAEQMRRAGTVYGTEARAY